MRLACPGLLTAALLRLIDRLWVAQHHGWVARARGFCVQRSGVIQATIRPALPAKERSPPGPVSVLLNPIDRWINSAAD
jgi:hypothetical protein